MESERIIKFDKYRLCINNQTYEPAEDSMLLMDLIAVKKGETVADIGSGSGVLGLHALFLGAKVVYFIDINPFATRATKCTLSLYRFSNYEIINCDLVSCLRSYIFDVAIFNPPYLPVNEYNEWIQFSWSGGTTGVEPLIKFLKIVKAKRIYTIYSSLDDEEYLLNTMKDLDLRIIKRKEKTIGFETLIGLEISNDSLSNS